MKKTNTSAQEPPKILTKAPKKFIKALDVSSILQEALFVSIHQSPISPVIALWSLESYLDAAKREQQRISRVQSSIWKDRKFRKNSLFHDVHFYLVSWSRIAKLARFIRDQTRFTRVGLVVRQYEVEFDKRIDGRDHLEYFEERLPGGPKQYKLKVPGDLYNMKNDYFTFGGKRINVGPSSIVILKKFVAEFHMALLFDSIELLEKHDPNRLYEILQQAATGIWLEKLTKNALKQLRSKQ